MNPDLDPIFLGNPDPDPGKYRIRILSPQTGLCKYAYLDIYCCFKYSFGKIYF